MLDDPCLADGFLYSPLKNGLMEVMTPLLAGLWILPPVLLGEDSLPAPVCWGIRVFAVKGVG